MGPFIIIVSILLFSMLWQTFFGKQTKQSSTGKHFSATSEEQSLESKQEKAA